MKSQRDVSLGVKLYVSDIIISFIAVEKVPVTTGRPQNIFPYRRMPVWESLNTYLIPWREDSSANSFHDCDFDFVSNVSLDLVSFGSFLSVLCLPKISTGVRSSGGSTLATSIGATLLFIFVVWLILGNVMTTTGVTPWLAEDASQLLHMQMAHN